MRPSFLSLFLLAIFQTVFCVEIEYALDSSTFKTVHINNAQTGVEYICSECKESVFPKKGAIKQHHFSHKRHSKPSAPFHSLSKVLTAVGACRGTGESTEHRTAKSKLQAILRQNKIVRVLNCEKIENNCYTDIQKSAFEDETRMAAPIIEVEFPLLDGGIADVAIVDAETKQPLVIFEIYRSSRTLNREGIWFELSATEVLDRANYEQGILTVNEQRLTIPASRACNAHTYKQKLWLAGYSDESISKGDTLDKMILNHWDEVKQQLDSYEDVTYPLEYRKKIKENGVSKRQKLIAYEKYHPSVYGYMDWAHQTKRWAKIWISDYQTISRAQNYIHAGRNCIACHQTLQGEEDWRILHKKCWRERRPE